MPRRNNRDRRFEPKEYTNQNGEYFVENSSDKKKPVRRKKDKWDKKIYYDND